LKCEERPLPPYGKYDTRTLLHKIKRLEERLEERDLLIADLANTRPCKETSMIRPLVKRARDMRGDFDV
jgi:hypothetical protein